MMSFFLHTDIQTLAEGCCLDNILAIWTSFLIDEANKYTHCIHVTGESKNINLLTAHKGHHT
jgi:hypothetical protein